MVRAGSRVLSFFAHPLDARILHAHLDGPLRPSGLDEALGWASPSTLRTAVGGMCEVGVLAKRDSDGAARSAGATTELTPAGRELLPVGAALEHWLREAPGGPLTLDDPAAQGIVRLVATSWDSTLVRALAERPVTLAELDARIPNLSYPAVKRRLAKLRSTKLAATVDDGEATAHTATDWLRRSVVPLAMAGRWELLHDPTVGSIEAVEVEAAFLLSLPLVDLPVRRLSGSCTLAVLLSNGRPGRRRDVAGVAVAVERGKIVSWSAGGDGAPPTTWAVGTPQVWLDALIDARADGLRTGGDKPRLAQALVDGIRGGLFAARAGDGPAGSRRTPRRRRKRPA